MSGDKAERDYFQPHSPASQGEELSITHGLLGVPEDEPDYEPGKRSLKEYCEVNGISIKRIRRANRQFGAPVANSGLGQVYWDNFSPPSGFVNDIDESLSQSQSQTQERDSPAYLLNSCDKPSRALPRRRYDDVDKSDILSLLDESFLDSPKSDLGIEDCDRTSRPYNEPDPFEDDEWSDSMLCSVSQQVEDDYSNGSSSNQPNLLNQSNSNTATRTTLCNITPSPILQNPNDLSFRGYSCSSTPLSSKENKPNMGKARTAKFCRKLNMSVQDCIGFEEISDDDMDDILSQMDIPN